MENPVLGQQLKVLSLWIVGCVMAVFVGCAVGSADYVSLVIGAVILALACLAIFVGRFFWVITIASSFFAGTFPILRGSFTPFQMLMAIGAVKFAFEDIVLRRTRIRRPLRFDLLMIIGFMSVLTLHAVHDRFGMRFLGSTIWGGRNYVNVFVGFAAFFIIQSIPINSKLWSKLPYLVLAVASFDLMIGIVTTIFPASIYKIYPFYSAVSRTGIEEIVTGTAANTSRLVTFGSFGFILITLILASVSWRGLLHPSNLLRAVTMVVGYLSVLYSSFRSSVFNALVVTMLAGIRDLRFKVLLLIPLLAVFFFGLSIVNSDFIRLPKEVQRSLTFIPGKWDTDVALDAAGSNEFRREVWTTWQREFFPLHPWIGRGFGFKGEWARPSVYRYDPEANRRAVEIGEVHNGLFAAVDAFGIIGAIFFVVWNARLLATALTVPFDKRAPSELPLRFLALYLATLIITYWFGAADVGSFLPTEFAIAGVLLHLRRTSNSDIVVCHAASEREGDREFTLSLSER